MYLIRCDRCRAENQIRYASPPKGWSTPVREDGSGTHICPSCTKSFIAEIPDPLEKKEEGVAPIPEPEPKRRTFRWGRG